MVNEALGGQPLLPFLKVRAAPTAAGFSLAGWLYLAVAAPTVDVPFGQRAVASPLIWPAAAAVSTLLLSCSEVADWEAGARRRLWPYRLSLLAVCLMVNAAAGLVLAPPYDALSLLTWFAALQAVALGCSVVFGDRAWLPLTGLILVAMFELAQDGSLLSRAVAASATPSLAIASSAVCVLAAICASDRVGRLSARRR